jgi:diaminohydroxyphosphoribosylaminopyrimidine deaminase/5-amino-6-(5-phosphoribosylamino)uracil reductase
MIVEELWMHRALQLAALGLGKVQPNPMVGAVIVHNERIIGEGFHQQYGAPHAEVNTINALENQELLKESTLYVNLEPCSHFGKTPPCTSLIIEKKIPKVVVGIKDPNQNVNGKGIKMLKDAGVEVVENVLQDECLKFNKRYFTYHIEKRPYIFLKWAQTKNGFMDIIRNNNNDAEQYWITNETLRVWAHKMRNEEQVILIGYNTLTNDNPLLTNRLYGTNQPHRFVWSDAQKPVITNDSFSFLTGNIEEILEELYSKKIQSVIVEGGKKTIQKFLDANLWDEAFVLVGNVEWKAGIEAPAMPYIFDNKVIIENETITHYSFTNANRNPQLLALSLGEAV